MKANVIDVGFEKLDYIYHLADVHIRNVKRHEEYKLVFDDLYSKIKSDKKENAIIFIAGDIVHAKTDMSPELVDMVFNFLNTLSKYHHVFVTAGNHDANLANKNRLDVLSPIINNIKSEKIHYLRNSGVYKIADCYLSVFGVFDEPTTWPLSKELKKYNGFKIATYHGPVRHSRTDVGYVVESNNVTVSLFDGFDLVLLGDIHKKQTLQEYNKEYMLCFDDDVEDYKNDGWEVIDEESTQEGKKYIVEKNNPNKPIIRYCGSTICQNYGEKTKGHGYSLWDLTNRLNPTYDHVELKNDYAYYTLEVNNGKVADFSDMPLKARLRLKVYKTSVTKLNKIISNIKKDFKPTEITQIRCDSLSNSKLSTTSGLNKDEDITDIEVQNKLIQQYLKKKFTVDVDTLKNVLELNKEFNNLLSFDNMGKNIKWKPVLFEWSNMFSYGENNKIDFTQMHDILGVFSKNASGKSSIMSSLSFCIFDKCDRAFKASNVLNNKKKEFKCKFVFDITNVRYTIERFGKKDKHGNVRVDVNFSKVENDEEVSLNGEDRRDTNSNIREYVGSYDDFILTTLSLQNNNAIFIDKSHSERKDILSQFLGIGVFDKLYTLSNDELKKINIIIENFNKDKTTDRISELQRNKDISDGSLADCKNIISELNKNKTEVVSEIDSLSEKIVNVDAPKDISKLEQKKKFLLQDKNDKIESINKMDSENKSKLSVLKIKKEELNTYDVDTIEKNVKELESLKEKQLSIQRKRNELKEQMINKMKKIDLLKTHEYDPNCKYCIQNPFVQDALDAKKSIEDDKTKALQLKNNNEEIDAKIKSLHEYEVKDSKYKVLNENFKSEKSMLQTNIEKYKTEKMALQKLESDIEYVEHGIELYHTSKKTIESNKKIQAKVQEFKEQLNSIEEKISFRHKEEIRLSSLISSINTELEDLKTKIKEVEDLEERHSSLQYYVEAVKRDGIAYELISKSVPIIENEVNNILGQLVEFNVKLELDGKNINGRIKYEDKTWPLEMCSGMERTISSLAIRITLTNISQLPRPNFMVIDESFGTLDSDNLNSMYSLFNFLKQEFDFCVIISHIDTMRDMVDNIIDIQKEAGFSKISF